MENLKDNILNKQNGMKYTNTSLISNPNQAVNYEL